MTLPTKTISAVHDFPTVSDTAWHQRVTEELKGQDPESALGKDLPGGLRVRPLYTPENSTTLERVLPEAATRPSRTGVRPWRIAVEIECHQRQQTASIIQADLDRGADLLWFKPSWFEPSCAKPSCFKHLDSLLGGVDFERIALVFESGAEVGTVAAHWRALHQGFDPQLLSGSLGGDPLGALAAQGSLGRSLESAWEELAALASQCSVETPNLRAALVSSLPYHHAGVTPADELACTLTGGMETLRRLTTAGLDIDRAASQILFAFGVGSDLFLEIAKLRAARLLWAKVVTASGGGEEACRMRIHARTSDTTWTGRAPWLNLLRGGIEGFAAAVTDVWSLGIQPFDTALGMPVDTSRRLAISTQHLLAEESHLGRVADPAAGSWYVEDLTAQLARAAWKRCREIESFGGLASALLEGKVQAWAGRNTEERERAVAHRREVIVGVSDFAHLGEKTPVREAVPAVPEEPSVTAQESAVQLATTFSKLRKGEGFEALRQGAEKWAAEHGRNPRVGLLGLGPLKEHAPRLNFARAFFAPGGVEAKALDSVESFEADAMEGVVLCGTDERYAAEALPLVGALRERKARQIFLAGKLKPEDDTTFREAGLHASIFLGADVLGLLRTFLEDLGVHP